MIELLLSLTLLVVLTGFLAGGLQLARRAFDADRRSSDKGEVALMARLLADQIARAFPVRDPRSGKLDFDGRGNAFAFAALEVGHANRAGVQHASVQQTASDLIIDVIPPHRAGGQEAAPQVNRIPLLKGVAQIRFNYFGRFKESDAVAWFSEWRAAERFPELVSLEIRFEDARQPPIAIVVALHQQS